MVKASDSDIDALVTLFGESGWKEMRLRYGSSELHLSKDGELVLADAGAAQATGEKPPADGAGQSTAAAASNEPAAVQGEVIRAPSVGTFYRAPEPGAKPFVEAGDAVEADTEVGLIEVMKLFTAVRAGRSGVIAEILAADGVLVEKDAPLFRLR